MTRLIWRRWVGRHPTGVDRVCLAYLAHFRDRSQAVIQHARYRRILDRKASARLFKLLLDPRGSVRRGIVQALLRSAADRPMGGRGRFYLNVGHTGLNDDGFCRWIERTEVKPIYLVHDLIPITHPQYCRAGERGRHEHRMQTVLTTAAGVIGNSQATIDELSDYSQSIGQLTPPAVAAWLGTTERLEPTRRAPLEGPFFVVLGTIEARKNHIVLLRIWERLIQRYGTEAPRLVIVGQRGWECDDVFALLDNSVALRTAVIEVGDCTDAELAAYLSNARALLFSSLVEGYGLPLVEALSAGIPVIASDLPVFREIGAEIPEFLDPTDEKAWENVIVSYAGDQNSGRDVQLAKLRSYRAPTWAEHFEKVEAWMERL